MTVEEQFRLKTLKTRPEYAGARPPALRDVAETLTTPLQVRMAHWLKPETVGNGKATITTIRLVLKWNERFFLPLLVVRDGLRAEVHVELRETNPQAVAAAARKLLTAYQSGFPHLLEIGNDYPFATTDGNGQAANPGTPVPSAPAGGPALTSPQTTPPSSPTGRSCIFKKTGTAYRQESGAIKSFQEALLERLRTITGNPALTLPLWNMHVRVDDQPSIHLEPDVPNGTIVFVAEIKGSGRLRVVRDRVLAKDYPAILAQYIALVAELLNLFPGLTDRNPINPTALGLAPARTTAISDNERGSENVTIATEAKPMFGQFLDELRTQLKPTNVDVGEWDATQLHDRWCCWLEPAAERDNQTAVVIAVGSPELGTRRVTVIEPATVDLEHLTEDAETFLKLVPQSLPIEALADSPTGEPAPTDDPPADPPASGDEQLCPDTRLRQAIEAASGLKSLIRDVNWPKSFSKGDKKRPQVKIGERRDDPKTPVNLIYQDSRGRKVGEVVKVDGAKAKDVRAALEQWLPANCPALGILYHPTPSEADDQPAPSDDPTVAEQLRQLTERAEKDKKEIELAKSTITSQQTTIQHYEKTVVPNLREQVKKLQDEANPAPTTTTTDELSQQLQDANATIERLTRELEEANRQLGESQGQVTMLTSERQAAEQLAASRQETITRLEGELGNKAHELNELRANATTAPASFVDLERFFTSLEADLAALHTLAGTQELPPTVKCLYLVHEQAVAVENTAMGALEAARSQRDTERFTAGQAALTSAFALTLAASEALVAAQQQHEERVSAWREIVGNNDLKLASVLEHLSLLADAYAVLKGLLTPSQLHDPHGWLVGLFQRVEDLVEQPTIPVPSSVEGGTLATAVELLTDTTYPRDAGPAAEEPTVPPLDDAPAASPEPDQPDAIEPDAGAVEPLAGDDNQPDLTEQLCLEALWDDKGQSDLLRFAERSGDAELCQRQFLAFWNAASRVSLGQVFRDCEGLKRDSAVDRLTDHYLTLGVTKKGAGAKARGFVGRCDKAGLFDEQGIFSCPSSARPEWVAQHNAWVDRLGLGTDYRVAVPETIMPPTQPDEDAPGSPDDEEPTTFPEDAFTVSALWDPAALRSMCNQARSRGGAPKSDEQAMRKATLGKLLAAADGKSVAECDAIVREHCAPLKLKGQGLAARARFICQRLDRVGLFVEGRLDRSRVTEQLRADWLANHNYAMAYLGIPKRVIN